MVEIVSIGDELLNGQTINTNASWMAAELTQRGLGVSNVVTIADEREAILDALNRASGRAEVVLMTGGLGPTKDDITKTTLCEYFDDRLERHQPTYDRIADFFRRKNVPLLEVNEQQADLPASCDILLNIRGTAQGMWFEKEGVIYVSMPGVPYEMQGIMREEVFPRLEQRFADRLIVQKSILTFGIGESRLADQLSEWENRVNANGLSFAYLPSPGQVKIRVTGKGHRSGDLQGKVERAVDELMATVGQHVYGFDHDTLSTVVGDLLREKGLTVGTAESCTGGFLAHQFTAVAGSSDYFQGSVVSYSNEVKVKVLGVSDDVLTSNGAVSEPVVRQMAEGARKVLGVDYAIATSGVAGPGGGTDEKPVGLVWIAVACPDKTEAFEFRFGKSRERNILLSALTGLNLLRLELNK